MKIFVISWPGRHENARSITRALANVGHCSHIVYSDDQHQDFPHATSVCRRPNQLFWGDKLNACLKHVGDDPAMFIQADCASDTWGRVIASAHHWLARDGIGLWSADIAGTFFAKSRVQIASIPNTSGIRVACVDGIVFGATSQVLARLRQTPVEHNIYGWGFDMFMSAHCHARGLSVVIDEAVSVVHPQGSGYGKTAAREHERQYRVAAYNSQELFFRQWIRSYVEAKIALERSMLSSNQS